VLLVLRAFGVWGVAYVVRQQQNPESKRASGTAGGTILCLNPEERRNRAGAALAVALLRAPSWSRVQQRSEV
jgi:hypothetical protein